MKISPVDPDIICLKRSLKTTDCTHLLFLNSAVNGRKFTKVLHDVTRSLQMKFLKSEWRYPKPFRNAKATNEGESADFAHFNLKFDCHGNGS